MGPVGWVFIERLDAKERAIAERRARFCPPCDPDAFATLIVAEYGLDAARELGRVLLYRGLRAGGGR